MSCPGPLQVFRAVSLCQHNVHAMKRPTLRHGLMQEAVAPIERAVNTICRRMHHWPVATMQAARAQEDEDGKFSIGFS